MEAVDEVTGGAKQAAVDEVTGGATVACELSHSLA